MYDLVHHIWLTFVRIEAIQAWICTELDLKQLPSIRNLFYYGAYEPSNAGDGWRGRFKESGKTYFTKSYHTLREEAYESACQLRQSMGLPIHE